MIAGWLVVIAVDLVVVPLVRPESVVPVLGLANTVGMTASGVALLVAVVRARGAAALRGVWRALGAGLTGAVAGAAVGLGMTAALPVSGHWRNAGLALLVGVCALIAFGVVVALLDGGDLRSVADPDAAESPVVVIAPRVAYVLGTTQGGTGRHVAMLARGCAADGSRRDDLRAGGDEVAARARAGGTAGNGEDRLRCRDDQRPAQARPGRRRRPPAPAAAHRARPLTSCTRTGCEPGLWRPWPCGPTRLRAGQAAGGRPWSSPCTTRRRRRHRPPRSTGCSSGLSRGGPTSCSASPLI